MKFPWITAALTAITLAIFFCPHAGQSLQYDSQNILSVGIVTGNFAHWSVDHLFWSLGTFVVLGTLCELRDPKRYGLCLLTSVVAIALALVTLQPQLRTYRGLSGIDSGLFMLLAVGILRERAPQRDRITTLALVLLIAAFLGKVTFEVVTERAFFVDSAGTFVPVPLAHLAGALAGAICCASDYLLPQPLVPSALPDPG